VAVTTVQFHSNERAGHVEVLVRVGPGEEATTRAGVLRMTPEIWEALEGYLEAARLTAWTVYPEEEKATMPDVRVVPVVVQVRAPQFEPEWDDE
jgi:hypothetical protein